METLHNKYSDYALTVDGSVISMKYGKRNKMTPSLSNCGYLMVCLRQNGKQYLKSVHRLIAQTFIPNPENKPQVNHIDSDKTNNTVSNLEWCTAKENQTHAIKAGIFAFSDKEHLIKMRKSAIESVAKFTKTEADMIKIIYKHMDTPSCRKIAEAYKVSKSTIERIVNGTTTIFKQGVIL